MQLVQVLEAAAVRVTVGGDREVADLTRHLRARVVADTDGIQHIGNTNTLRDRTLPGLTPARHVQDGELLGVAWRLFDDRLGGGAALRLGQRVALPLLAEFERLVLLDAANQDVLQPQLPAKEQENENARGDQDLAEHANDAHPTPATRTSRPQGAHPAPVDTHSHDCKR